MSAFCVPDITPESRGTVLSEMALDTSIRNGSLLETGDDIRSILCMVKLAKNFLLGSIGDQSE